MHTGRFKLEKTTLPVGDVNRKRVAVTIPAGDIVELVANPSPKNEEMVDVLWEGRTVAMYAIDLN
jgi:ribosomal protein L21E